LRQTVVDSDARSSRRRASCRDRASKTRQCDPTHRAYRSGVSTRRWCKAASRGGINCTTSFAVVVTRRPESDLAQDLIVFAPCGLHAHMKIQVDTRPEKTFELATCSRPDLLDHPAALADDNRLLRFAVDDDGAKQAEQSFASLPFFLEPID